MKMESPTMNDTAPMPAKSQEQMDRDTMDDHHTVMKAHQILSDPERHERLKKMHGGATKMLGMDDFYKGKKKALEAKEKKPIDAPKEEPMAGE